MEQYKEEKAFLESILGEDPGETAHVRLSTVLNWISKYKAYLIEQGEVVYNSKKCSACECHTALSNFETEDRCILCDVDRIADKDIQHAAEEYVKRNVSLIPFGQDAAVKEDWSDGAKWGINKSKRPNQFIPVAPAQQWNLNLNVTWPHEHGVFVLTNSRGDTYTGKSEELADFIISSESNTSTK